jgi:deoxyhypusine synthase
MLDKVNEVTIKETLVGVTLTSGERTEDDTIGFLGKLVRDERFHAAEKKLREQVLDKLLGRLARDTELLDAGIVGLADSEG